MFRKGTLTRQTWVDTCTIVNTDPWTLCLVNLCHGVWLLLPQNRRALEGQRGDDQGKTYHYILSLLTYGGWHLLTSLILTNRVYQHWLFCPSCFRSFRKNMPDMDVLGKCQSVFTDFVHQQNELFVWIIQNVATSTNPQSTRDLLKIYLRKLSFVLPFECDVSVPSEHHNVCKQEA